MGRNSGRCRRVARWLPNQPLATEQGLIPATQPLQDNCAMTTVNER